MPHVYGHRHGGYLTVKEPVPSFIQPLCALFIALFITCNFSAVIQNRWEIVFGHT